jgi:hypothetical protein
VPHASQDWKQAFVSGIPFAHPIGATTGLPMATSFGESKSAFSYVPFLSSTQETSAEKRKAISLLNDIGVVKENPEEFMVEKDLVEIALDGKRVLLTINERQQVLDQIGDKLATYLVRHEKAIRAAKARSHDDARKLVDKFSDLSREAVLSRWRDHIRQKKRS